VTRRVLVLSTLYPNSARPTFGGFVARSLEALAARGGWDVTVVNPIGLPPLALGPYAALARAVGDGWEHGVMVHRPRFTMAPRVGGRWNPTLIARRVLPLARQLHARTPFDLVDAQFFYPDGPAAAAIARALGLPLSIKARGADIHFWGARGYARRRMLDASNQAAGLLAVSEALKRDMVALGMPGEKIAIHPTGLDRAAFHPIPRASARAGLADFGIPPDGALLVGVGALIPRKGHALTLRGLAALPGVRLALVGAGPEERELRALATELGLGDRVSFLGSIAHDRLPRLLAAADAMVLPSVSEGLANAWIEALGCGTPLVIADAGGAREVVTWPAAGRIVPRDPSASAATVRELLAHPPSQREVARCAERFTWEANGAALAEHYDRILAKP
jgi:glycosyltransferase involved in cell wall biosynthesis